MTFEDLVAARGPALMRLAVMLTGNVPDAEDLLQDTVAKAHRHAERIAAMDAPAAYLRRVMVNEHANTGRAKRRRPILVPLGQHDRPSDPATETGPDEETWRALSGLPARQRAVLVLRYYEGLTDREIADLFGTAESTVRSNASRGLEQLRAHLTRRPQEEDR